MLDTTDPIDIRCPDCGGLAAFEEPFLFLPSGKQPPEGAPTRQWGNWTVVERFPSLISWAAPSGTQQFLRDGGPGDGGGYPLWSKGVVRCPHCHCNRVHDLDWPGDAYWQWDIRGALLWAWDARQAQAILDYIRASSRPARKAPNIRYVPSEFLSRNVRDEVVSKMERSLGAAG